MQREVMTVKQVAEYLKMDPHTVYRMVRSGKLPSTKLVGQWRIMGDLLDKWLEEKSVKGRSELGHRLDFSDSMKLVDMPVPELISMADDVRKKFIGNKLELCSITNAKSGACKEDCKFCAQSSRYKTESPVYALKDSDTIVDEAGKAKEIGAKRFGIVASGRAVSDKELFRIADAISRIRENVDIELCASLGMLSKEQLSLLKQAGLSRYHHNIETSSSMFPKIISTHTIEERIETIKNAKAVGLEVCSGGIIGMGEDWKDRINMACLLRDLSVDSIPINILVPIKGTPLEQFSPISALDVIRTIAIFRLILRDKTIKVAAGRESALKDFQGLAFLAGANGMLIGGYLTVKGREVGEDRCLIGEIEKAWTG